MCWSHAGLMDARVSLTSMLIRLWLQQASDMDTDLDMDKNIAVDGEIGKVKDSDWATGRDRDTENTGRDTDEDANPDTVVTLRRFEASNLLLCNW